MAFSSEQTTRWVATKISELTDVKQTDIPAPNLLHIVRKDHPPFTAAVISVPFVTSEIIAPILQSNPDIEIVVNVPKDSYWAADAIRFAIGRHIAFGGLGDLMSAIDRGLDDVREYVRREFEFVERGLRQHKRVLSVNRGDERAYTIERAGLPALRFVMLNEYELTGEHVRSARERYGDFSAILLNNPNGKPTSQALQVAKNLNIEIFKWSEFWGRLNRR